MFLTINPVVQELLPMSQSYFANTTQRCHIDNIPVYRKYTGEACVIGNIVMPQDQAELYWLSAYRGAPDGLMYGLFGISPMTRFVHAAVDLSLLHDRKDSWDENGFTKVGWESFYRLADLYLTRPTRPQPTTPTATEVATYERND